jgi:hypothetical protein
MNKHKKLQSIYYMALILMLLNRVLVRNPEGVLPETLLHNEFFITTGLSLISICIMIFTAFATYKYFTFKGVRRLYSIINAILSPLFWPLIMLVQMAYSMRLKSLEPLVNKEDAEHKECIN